jgi:hypothetical protein
MTTKKKESLKRLEIRRERLSDKVQEQGVVLIQLSVFIQAGFYPNTQLSTIQSCIDDLTSIHEDLEKLIVAESKTRKP